MKESKTSKKVLIAMFVLIFAYVGFASYTQIKVGVELSPTLTVCFFSVMGLEFTQLAGIKKSKQKTLDKLPTNLSDFAKIVLEEFFNDSEDSSSENEEEGDI
ncbi:MAG: hypothetical protein ACI4PU_07255 [Intestinibacter sp.]